MFHIFPTKWWIHCAYAIRQLSGSAMYSYDFHRCCNINVCIRQNSRASLVLPVPSRSRFAVHCQHSAAVQKILCAEMTDFLPRATNIHTFLCLCRVWQGKATKKEDGIKKDVAVLKISPLDCFHNHFSVASRKQVAWEGQEVMCSASALDCQLRLSILNNKTKKVI